MYSDLESVSFGSIKISLFKPYTMEEDSTILRLSEEFKNENFEIEQTFKMCFDISFYYHSGEFVNDWLTNCLISIKPINDKIEEFFDYII